MSWLLSSLPSIPLWSDKAEDKTADAESDEKHNGGANAEDDEEDLDVPPPFPLPNSSQRSSAPNVVIPSSPPSSAPALALAPPSPTHSAPSTPPSDLNIAILPDPIPLGNMAPPPSTTARPDFGIKPGGGLTTPSSSSGLAPTLAAKTVTTPKKKGKVALAPGCSALDWARLTRSGVDLRGTGAGAPRRITVEELKKHKSTGDAWSAFNGVVYNITPYLRFHPGGEDELMRVAGRDGTRLFMLTHSWVNLEHLLAECAIGMLVRS